MYYTTETTHYVGKLGVQSIVKVFFDKLSMNKMQILVKSDFVTLCLAWFPGPQGSSRILNGHYAQADKSHTKLNKTAHQSNVQCEMR